MKPAFHADHIGSLLRPERLIAAARSAREGKLDAAGFRAVQDECIREAVALQESVGVPARPALPSTLLTSGNAAMMRSCRPMRSLASSIEMLGKVTGMYRNEP